jgi:hypothetical protein
MNILVVGDSISSIDACGLGTEINKHYVVQLESKNHKITNLSIGAQSNQKIAYKTCLELSTSSVQYDLVIVQWSTLFRLNLNNGSSIYDNTFNLTAWGYNSKSSKLYKPLWSIWSKYFIHPRIEILEWMTQLILLDNFLSNQNIPYIFVKGFDNFVNDIEANDWNNTSEYFKSGVLRIDEHPDQEITEIYNELVLMYENICKQSNWLNLHSASWHDGRDDLAEDALHPGPLSHINYYNSLEKYTKTLGLSINNTYTI